MNKMFIKIQDFQKAEFNIFIICQKKFHSYNTYELLPACDINWQENSDKLLENCTNNLGNEKLS